MGIIEDDADIFHLEATKFPTSSEEEVHISEAKEKAKSESQRILTTGDVNLKDVQNKIDTKFNEAVDLVVSTVLKAKT